MEFVQYFGREVKCYPTSNEQHYITNKNPAAQNNRSIIMLEWLAEQNPRDIIPIISVIGGVIFLTTIIVTSHWASVRRVETKARLREAELALKQEMIERGMSADDIIRVIDAGQRKAVRDEEDAGEPSSAIS